MPWVAASNLIFDYSLSEAEVECECGVRFGVDEDWLGPNFDTFTCPKCQRRYEVRLELWLLTESEPAQGVGGSG